MEDQEQHGDDIFEALGNGVYAMKETIQQEQAEKGAIKFYLSLYANFHLSVDNSFKTDPPAVLPTEPVEVLESTYLNDTLDSLYDMLIAAIDKFEYRGSGWILDKLLKLDLHVLQYSPLHASTYMPLPNEISIKKAVVNIQNIDQKCFLWAAIAGVFTNSCLVKPERVSNYYPFEHAFNLQGITFPVTLKDIPKFEKQNDVSISVYGWEQKWKADKQNVVGFPFPLKVSKEVKAKHVNMLLISNNDTNHYCWIKKMFLLYGITG